MIKNYLRLLKLGKGSRSFIIISLIASLITVIIQITIPFYFIDFIDQLTHINQVDFNTTNYILFSVLCLFIISGILLFFNEICCYYLGSKITVNIRKKIFEQLHQIDLKNLDIKQTGDVVNLVVNDCDNIYEAVVNVFINLFSSIFMIIGATVGMFFISWIMAIVVLILSPIVIISSKLLSNYILKSYKVFQNKTAELNQLSLDYLNNGKSIVDFDYQTAAYESFKKENHEYYKYAQTAQFAGAIINPTTRLVNNLIYVVLGLVGAYCYFQTGLSIGQITIFFTFSTMFSKPFNQISSVIDVLYLGNASFSRVDNFLVINKCYENYQASAQGFIFDSNNDLIEFQNVSFSYNENQKLIQNLDLVIKPNMKVAIVGPTGAGKSTLVNLLLRFYDCNEGIIKIGNTNIKSPTVNALRSNFGLVLQESWVYEASILDNLLYGNNEVSLDKVYEVCQSCGLHYFIESLPQKYDTIISNDKQVLSQGQKQLLTIARALLVEPQILILDEATSSVDNETERLIRKTFVKAMNNRTSFFIAHRLINVINSDLILVVSNGDIIEKGTHQELLACRGLYTRLYEQEMNNEK